MAQHCAGRNRKRQSIKRGLVLGTHEIGSVCGRKREDASDLTTSAAESSRRLSLIFCLLLRQTPLRFCSNITGTHRLPSQRIDTVVAAALPHFSGLAACVVVGVSLVPHPLALYVHPRFMGRCGRNECFLARVLFVFVFHRARGARNSYSWGMQVIDWGANLFFLSGVSASATGKSPTAASFSAWAKPSSETSIQALGSVP